MSVGKLQQRHCERRGRAIEDVPSSVKTTGFPGLFPMGARRERELGEKRCASRHSRMRRRDHAPAQSKGQRGGGQRGCKMGMDCFVTERERGREMST